MKTSPKDRQAIDQLFKEHHYTDDLGVIKSKLAGYVAGVRQEVRAAVFKEAVTMLIGLPAQGTMNYRRGYEEGVRDAIRTLEAATTKQPTEVKEGDDG